MAIKKSVLLKRILWVFFPAVLLLTVGVAASNFYLIYRLSHPQPTPLYGSPRDFQIILAKPMWFDETWKNSDGTESVGWFLSRGKPGPAVILSHGYGSNRSELLTLSFELWKAGYHVLLYDLRGHGESPVKWSGLGTYEKDDLLSAIKFIRSKKTEDGQDLIDGRIGLYGVHLGGYISLVAASQDPVVKAVAVDSIYPDVASFINHRLRMFLGRDNALADYLVDSPWRSDLTELAMQVYLLRREDHDEAADAAAGAAGRKFLFLTAKTDPMLDDMTRRIHAQARDQKTLVEVEKSRLERLYLTASSEYDARVVAFFSEALPVPGAARPVKPAK